jgi:ATP/maltotriose-dependent transcriptional regulator MalT
VRDNSFVKLLDDSIPPGMAALRRRDWAAARTHFEAAIERQETAPALDGLAEALFWLDEVAPSLDQRSRAYVLYRKSGEVCSAARAALWLAIGYASAYDNVAVARGWMQRAERLLHETGPCAEHGWLELFRGKMTADTTVTVSHAQHALEIARQHDDPDLEVWALSEQGRALVAMGRVDEGMAMLDEAVAAATGGEARSPLVVGQTCCNMLSACDRASDFQRAVQWCQVLDEFTRRNRYTPIFHYCRVVYSGVLIATGRWEEAERELKTAIRTVERKYPFEKVHSLSRLTILCVRQGRLEEAAQLLSGFETHAVAAEAAAMLYLARGKATLATTLLERRLAVIADGLAAIPLLRLLVDARLGLGDIHAARAAAGRMSDIADRSNCRPARAASLLANANVAVACGDPGHALFEEASTIFHSQGMPFDAAVTRLAWSRAVAGSAREIAAEDARLALAALEKLGARQYADEASALLRELGAGSKPGPRLSGELTRREHDVLDLLSHGLSNFEIGGRLFISPKTVEHHVGRILSKLGLRNRAEAVAWALRNSSQKYGTK